MPQPSVQRIQIVGASCAGKTTLGRALAERLGLPFTDIDDLWWSPGWVEAGHAALRERLAPIAASPAWVVAGNYHLSTELVLWPRVQWVIVIDLPLPLLMSRAVWRTLRRGFTGERCCNGNREQIHRLFHPDGVVRYTWRNRARRRIRYATLASDPALAHATVTRLTHPEDAQQLLGGLATTAVSHATGSP